MKPQEQDKWMENMIPLVVGATDEERAEIMIKLILVRGMHLANESMQERFHSAVEDWRGRDGRDL